MHTSVTVISRNNNFDLIRLLAALQVFLFHLKDYLGFVYPSKAFFSAIVFFPGVPVFFVLSGFLIFSSYERNKKLMQYFKNRILRIFPALWVAFFVLFAVIYFHGYQPSLFSLIKWTFAQLTLFQYHHPAEIQTYIGGNPNAALWTIQVEFSFYIMVPLFFWLTSKTKSISMTWLLVILFILSYLLNYYMLSFQDLNGTMFAPMVDKVFPYLFYFLAGALSYLHFEKLKRFYIGKGLYWLGAYILYSFIAGIHFGVYRESYFLNGYSLIGFLILSQTVISLAFTFPDLSNRLLRGTDISYGIYIYHMIVIGIFYKHGGYGDVSAFWPAVVITINVSILSWLIVEKPALKLKNVAWSDLFPFGFRSLIVRKIKGYFEKPREAKVRRT